MKKQELIQEVATRADVPKHMANKVLDALVDTATCQLRAGNEVSIHGIGKLRPVEKPTRKARNPQTGEPVTVPARTNVSFQAAKRLKDTLNR